VADHLEVIPEARRETTRAALVRAFRAKAIGPPTLLKGGVSGALIYRVPVGERVCLLRLEPERIPLDHRRRGFDCMIAAAEVGVAPRVFHADAAAGVAVLDFVETRPLSEHPGGPAGVARDLGALIARIQTTDPFPLLAGGDDPILALLNSLSRSGLFPPDRLDGHLAALERIRAILPWDPAAAVSSHNDPNPRNLIFDGRRLWLIDWELASRNDPLFDLAIVSTDLAATPEFEDALLTGALGRAPDAALSARLWVVRLLTRLFYGCIALEVFAGDPRFAPDASLDAPSPSGFQAAIAEGGLGAAAPEQTAYAFDGVAAPGFEATLALARCAETPASR